MPIRKRKHRKWYQRRNNLIVILFSATIIITSAIVLMLMNSEDAAIKNSHNNNFVKSNVSSENNEIKQTPLKLTTFGDSITDGGTWQQPVIDYFNFTEHIKLGYPGEMLYWFRNHIDKIPTDTDVLLVMGGTNDMGQNLDIADFKDGIKSLHGSLKERLPKTLIVFMSPLSGRGTTTGENMVEHVYNKLGLSTEDYAIAMKEVCIELSIPFINVYHDTDITQQNRAAYIADEVHPNQTGGKKIAEVVINGLKEIDSELAQ